MWRITEDTAIGMADKVASDISEHPFRAAGEVAVGVAAIGATILSAPEVAAGTGVVAVAAGISEAGAELVGGLVAAGWLTIPYVGIGTSVGKDTVAGLKNTGEDRRILMNPENYPPERIASADANIQKHLGPPALESMQIATGVLGTTYFAAPTVAAGFARAGEIPKAPSEPGKISGDSRLPRKGDARDGKVDEPNARFDVTNPAYDKAVHAARAYVAVLREKFESGRPWSREGELAETRAKHEYMDSMYQLRDQYGYGLLNPEALEALAKTAGNRLVVDFGAGNGYAASLMQQMGLRVKAIDVAPVGDAPNQYWYNPQTGYDPAQFRSWVPVEKGDATTLRDAPKDSVLFLSWPPPDSASTAALRNFHGQTIVVLTETGDSTGTRSFWNTLRDDFNLDRRVAISPMQSAAGEPFIPTKDGPRLIFDSDADPRRQELLIYQRRDQTTPALNRTP
jgi:hypothetical protein